MDKTFWKDIYIYEKYKPVLICPSCNVGLLTLNKDNIRYFETAASKASQDDPAFEHYWTQFRFSAILICNNPTCKDIVSSSGSGGLEGEYEEDEDGYPINVYKTFFKPKYFEPPLNILPLKKEYPDKINNLLVESFAVFFSDYSSCANKIRQVVEKLLTIKGIKKFRTNSRKELPLHNRIDFFKTKYPKYADLADQLLAIKWIGNAGSHEGKIGIDNVLNAYSILQNCLDHIYIHIDHQVQIKRLAKEINKRKGK